MKFYSLGLKVGASLFTVYAKRQYGRRCKTSEDHLVFRLMSEESPNILPRKLLRKRKKKTLRLKFQGWNGPSLGIIEIPGDSKSVHTINTD